MPKQYSVSLLSIQTISTVYRVMLNTLRYLNILSHLKTEIEILAPVKLTEALRIFIRVKKEALYCLANVTVLPVSLGVTFLQNRV